MTPGWFPGRKQKDGGCELFMKLEAEEEDKVRLAAKMAEALNTPRRPRQKVGFSFVFA